jgi:hypothetical protein
LLLCLPAAARAADPPAADVEFFEKEVRPLLVANCWQCHGPAKARGGLRLTSRELLLQGGDSGPAAVAGKPEDSLLVRAVRYQDSPRMPPRGKLTDRQIGVLERWVKRGLPWPGTTASSRPAGSGWTITDEQRQFWAFRTVQEAAVPAVRDAAWARTPVDRFILAALEARGLRPAPPADKRTLLRRVTFDLIGLPPTPAEIDAFLGDQSPDAFARVVDRLLASPQYGERWGRHWLDVVRYADARDLIQLPAESDFREVWRYRDWVVGAFNRDLPYADFVRYQVAGDLLPPRPGSFDPDGIVATGLLALADFVPGDVDKEQMIADYVNDQIDVVGRAFLGLTLACARCHDHKFDPIRTEDYYALAGIFFSTRLIPGPVPGNTPLVRVPLLPPDEVARLKVQDEADRRRRAERERQLAGAADRDYLAHAQDLVARQTARYLVAACESRRQPPGMAHDSVAELARRHRLDAALLAGWVKFLDTVSKGPPAAWPPVLRDAAAGKLAGPDLERSAQELQRALAAAAPTKQTLDGAALVRLRADDPHLASDGTGRVTRWPNRCALAADATPPSPGGGPVKVSAAINGHTRPVLRFDGNALLEVPRQPPPNGTLFVVYRTASGGSAGQRLLGWEDSDVGHHGVGLMPAPGGALHAILRDNGRVGDVMDARPVRGFEIASVSWGPAGTTLHRDGAAAGARGETAAVSADPGIAALRVGGPGSGSSPRFRGDVAEVRVYDRKLTEAERRRVEEELRSTWFGTGGSPAPPSDPVALLYQELLSARGPFWAPADQRLRLLPAEARSKLAAWGRELDALKNKRPREVPQAVAVQDGGPPGTRHAGFQDAHVFLRGNHKKLGKTVPRGFPRILMGQTPARITQGSGRRQLAEWLTRADNPLTARVMVNRIWQHHFGAGLVRTPNDFGTRGERPTHPELLDYLAARFVASGWSVKAMHRLMLLSATYQQDSRGNAAAVARDPDNRLFGRMDRRRLDAEAVRDSLLAVAGRLDPTFGGPAFTDLATPRRTLYLLAARTGANTSDFGRLFDRADPGSIVGQRGQSVVAPQALFFLNDPFVATRAGDLAARIAREAPSSDADRIRLLYRLTLGRPPTPAESDLGIRLLAEGGPMPSNAIARSCCLPMSLSTSIDGKARGPGGSIHE